MAMSSKSPNVITIESKVLSTTSKKVTPTTQVVAAAASQQNKRPKVTSVKVTT